MILCSLNNTPYYLRILFIKSNYFQEVLVDYKDEEWLIETLDESLENAVKVLDTGPTWQNQNLINANKNLELNVNTYEIAIVNYLITALMKVILYIKNCNTFPSILLFSLLLTYLLPY